MKLRKLFAAYYRCRRVVSDWLFFLFSSDWEAEHWGDYYCLYENGELEFEGYLKDLPWRIRTKWASRLATLDDLEDRVKEMDERWAERRRSEH